MHDRNLHAQRLQQEALAGDAAAHSELLRLTQEALNRHLERMITLLCSHACLFDAHMEQVPATPRELNAVVIAAVGDAVRKWQPPGDWVDFSVRFAVRALWDAVRAAFIKSAHEAVIESFDARHPQPRVSIKAVLQAVCAEAPEKWLMKLGAPEHWPAFVRARADEYFRAAGRRLGGRTFEWEYDKEVKEAVERLATKYARRSSGFVDTNLRAELVSEARYRVLLARQSYAPAKGSSWLSYAMEAADNAMLAYLDPLRRHDLMAIWLRIVDAIEQVRDHEKREPRIEEILDAMDPPAFRGQRKRPKYSRGMVRKIMALFMVDRGGADAKPDRARRLAGMEALIDLARLNEQEKMALRLVQAGLSHREIAAELGITEGRSRTLKHEALAKLEAAAVPLTSEEWGVLQLLFVEGKSPIDIAKALKIAQRDTHLIRDGVAEKLRLFPAFRAALSPAEWEVLNLALTGFSPGQISHHTGRTEPEVTALLEEGLAKLKPGNA